MKFLYYFNLSVSATTTDNMGDTLVQKGSHSFKLSELAYLRSGDKGNTANIGVIARHSSFIPYLRKHLTAEVVENYFEHLLDSAHCYQGSPRVERYVIVSEIAISCLC